MKQCEQTITMEAIRNSVGNVGGVQCEQIGEIFPHLLKPQSTGRPAPPPPASAPSASPAPPAFAPAAESDEFSDLYKYLFVSYSYNYFDNCSYCLFVHPLAVLNYLYFPSRSVC